MMNKFVLAVGFVLALCVHTKSSAQLNVERDFLFYRSVEVLSTGVTDEPKRILQNIVNEDSTYAPAYYYLSKIALQERRSTAARNYIDRAMALDSLNLDYREALFYIASSQNDTQCVIDCLKIFVEELPNEPYFVIILAQIYGDMRLTQESLKICALYEERYGLDIELVDLMRRLYIFTEDYYSALGLMMRAVESDPNNIAYRLLYGELAQGLGDNNTAEVQYREAREIDPTNIDAQLSLMTLYERAGLYPQFIATLHPIFSSEIFPIEEKIKIFEENFFSPDIYQGNYYAINSLMTTLRFADESNVEVQLLYGRYLSYTGDLEASKEVYEEMLAQNPKEPNQTVLERLIDINLFEENPQRAIELAKIGKKHYDEQSFLLCEIIAYSNDNQIKKATKLIDKAARAAKSDSIASELYGMKGDILHSAGELDAAFKAYEVALKYNPYNSLVLNNYGYFLAISSQRLDDALVMTSRANKLTPDNPTYLDSEAWVLFLMGRYAEAQTIMRRVIALDNNPSGEVLMHYGDVLYAMGNDFLARSYWKRALSAGAQAIDIEERMLRPKAQTPQ